MSRSTDRLLRQQAEARRLERARSTLNEMGRIINMVGTGLTHDEIRRRLGISAATLWRRMRPLGLVDGRRRPQRKRQQPVVVFDGSAFDLIHAGDFAEVRIKVPKKRKRRRS